MKQTAKGHQSHLDRGALSVRVGESLVSVTRRVLSQPDGSTRLEASFQPSDLPPPERSYVADAAMLRAFGEGVEMVFGQSALQGGRLRSLVSVRLFAEPIRQFLKTCEQFLPALQAFVERNEIAAVAVAPTLFVTEPDQAVSLAATVISVGFSGREAACDFYHVSPFAIARLNERSDLPMEAVVRITLPTGALLQLLLQLQSLQSQLPKDVQ